MLQTTRHLLIVLAVLTLAACSAFSDWGASPSEPAPASVSPAPAAAVSPPPSDSGIPPGLEGSEAAGIVIRGPDGRLGSPDGPENAEYRTDSDACYNFAQGQVAHDLRMEADSDAALVGRESVLGLITLRQRMSEFERSNRLPALFQECMVSRGYARD